MKISANLAAIMEAFRRRLIARLSASSGVSQEDDIRLVLDAHASKTYAAALSVSWKAWSVGASTRTGPREVLLPPPVRRLLSARRKDAKSPFVFPSRKVPDAPIGKIDNSRKVLRRLAGLPEDIRLHDLHHTYASHAIMQSQSLTIAGKLLGHRDPARTERYARLDGEYLGAAAERVALIVQTMMDMRG